VCETTVPVQDNEATMRWQWGSALLLLAALGGCGGTAPRSGSDAGTPHDAGSLNHDAGSVGVDGGMDAGSVGIDAGLDAGSVGIDGGAPLDGGVDAGSPSCTGGGATGTCYEAACPVPHLSLQDNRDRLLADLAKRKCTDACTLWAALSQAERYIFLMDTAYLASSSSRLYPPGAHNTETALDHATALYSVNAPKAGQGVDLSGRGGQEYNRIYLGFDGLATCLMRDALEANPSHLAGFNEWAKSDDLAGPHKPFTQREMIVWYRAVTDLSSNGPQFHHWASDADFNQNAINQRLGVCGVTDRSLTELTIAFDFYHSSDPLGDYAGRGGYGWQIVDQHLDINAAWTFMPTGCPVTAPVNTDPYGGGTFAGMGPSLQGGTCTSPKLGSACF
jgi:hypothetical protein